MTAAVVSSAFSRLSPVYTVTMPASVVVFSAITRIASAWSSGSIGIVSTSGVVPDGLAVETAGSPSMFSVDAITAPDSSTTCTNADSSPGNANVAGRAPASAKAATSRARSVAAVVAAVSSRLRTNPTSNTALTASATPTARTATAVTRNRSPTRRRTRSAAIGNEAVAGTPNGAQAVYANGLSILRRMFDMCTSITLGSPS